MFSVVKSLSQLHLQLVTKKNIISHLFQQLQVGNISQQQDYQNQNLTFQKIFSLIPNEQTLKQIQENIQIKQKQYKLVNYHGQYQIVHKIKHKIQSLKNDAKDIYYLFTQLNLPKIQQEFKKDKQNNKIKLASYQLINPNGNNHIQGTYIHTNNFDTKYVKEEQQQKGQKDKTNIRKKQTQKQKLSLSLYNNKNNIQKGSKLIMNLKSTKCQKFQRNTISQDYIYSIRQSSINEQLQPQSQYLKNDDLLITVCIYDSLNRQKQHEFLVLGEMKLIQLKKQIYCVIEKIRQDQKEYRQNGTNEKYQQNELNSYEYKSSLNKKSFVNKQLKPQSCFLLIQQNLYYHGSHSSQQQVDNLIKNIQSSYQMQFHKYSMNNIELKSLRVVFGRPYIYRHMGGCDHMIVFKDIKLYNKQTGIQPECKNKYPLLIFQSKMKKKKCQGCQIKFAALACQGDKLKNGKTTYLCKQCHQNIHNQLTNTQNKFMVVLPYRHQ